MRKLPLLTITLGLIVPTLLIDGHAGQNHLDLHVRTAVTDIVVTHAPSGITLTATPASSLVPLADANRPALPYRILQVIVPRGERVVGVTASARATETIARGVTPSLAPAATPESGEARSPSAPAEASLAPDDGSDAYPSALVRYLGTGTWHGCSVASIAVFPVQVLGDRVALHTEVDVRVDLAASSESDLAVRALRASPRAASEIANEIRTRVENPNAIATYPLPRTTPQHGAFAPTSAPSEDGSAVDYLIITTAALEPSFQVLADWKTAKGIATQVRTVDWIQANTRRGSDLAETIRFFLQDAYANWGLRYVLLAGDTPEIPPRYLYSEYFYGGTFIPGDIYFACLDGTFNADGDTRFGEQPADAPDLYPELVVGRLPVSDRNNADVMVGKIMSYEAPVDTEYTDKVLMLAEVLFPSPWTSGPIQLNGADITDVTYVVHVASPERRVTRVYETPWLYAGSVQESRAIAIDSLEAGFSQVFHVGHGFRFNMHCADENIAIPDADALAHPNRYFNLFMLNCTGAAFDYDCFGEHLLRNPGGGAVSVIGAVNSAFPLAAAAYLDDYAEALYHDGVVELGNAFALSRLRHTPLAELGDNVDLWTHYIYTVLGDPEMQVWTGRVRTPEVALPDSVSAGDNAIPVHVTVDGAPVANASVCLRKGGEDYRVAETDAFGWAVVMFTSPTAGTIDVVVTGTNLARTSSNIRVAGPAGAVLKLGTVTIDDDNLDGTFGNGDGVIDAGEVVDLFPSVQDFGVDPFSEIALALNTTSPYITVLDPIAQIEQVVPNASTAALDAWRIAVAAGAPDVAVASFQVMITDGTFLWYDAFERVLHAPALEVTALRKSDAPPVGNGDGVIATGEQFRLYCTLKNYGTGAARGLTAVLRALDGGSTVIDSLSTFADARTLGAVENTVGFKTERGQRVDREPARARRDGLARARAATTRSSCANRALPSPVVRRETGRRQDGAHVDPRARRRTRTVTTCTTRSRLAVPSCAPTSDVVTHTLFTDAGLAPSTRYYYAVTAVDQSGNESAFSPLASASTDAAAAGRLAQRTRRSVGQLADDRRHRRRRRPRRRDRKRRLYAWHDDGREVVDGDGQALTWGVFSALGVDFIGPAALAESRRRARARHRGRRVHVEGGVLSSTGPGNRCRVGRRPTVDVVRASVAIGDIDGDGGRDRRGRRGRVPVRVARRRDRGHRRRRESRHQRRLPSACPTPTRCSTRCPRSPTSTTTARTKSSSPPRTRSSTCSTSRADEPGWPRTLPNYAGGGVAVGDHRRQRRPRDRGHGTRGTGEIYALHHNNTQDVAVAGCQHNLFFNPSPALADITGDGKLETLIPASNGRLYAIQSNGSDLRPAGRWSTTRPTRTPSRRRWSRMSTATGRSTCFWATRASSSTDGMQPASPLDGLPAGDEGRGARNAGDHRPRPDGDVDIVAVGLRQDGVRVGPARAIRRGAGAVADVPRQRPSQRDAMASTCRRVGATRPRALRAAARTELPEPLQSHDARSRSRSPTVRRGEVSLVVYDVTGARVRTLRRESGASRAATSSPGTGAIRAAAVGSGVYFYRLATPAPALTRKMVLLK